MIVAGADYVGDYVTLVLDLMDMFPAKMRHTENQGYYGFLAQNIERRGMVRVYWFL